MEKSTTKLQKENKVNNNPSSLKNLEKYLIKTINKEHPKEISIILREGNIHTVKSKVGFSNKELNNKKLIKNNPQIIKISPPNYGNSQRRKRPGSNNNTK